MDNDFYNNYGYLEIFGGIYLRKFPLLTKRVRGRIETFSMSALILRQFIKLTHFGKQN